MTEKCIKRNKHLKIYECKNYKGKIHYDIYRTDTKHLQYGDYPLQLGSLYKTKEGKWIFFGIGRNCQGCSLNFDQLSIIHDFMKSLEAK